MKHIEIYGATCKDHWSYVVKSEPCRNSITISDDLYEKLVQLEANINEYCFIIEKLYEDNK